MGLFNKIKNIFKTENIEENVSDIPEKVENKKKSVEVYEKGLTKSREGFVSRLASLTNKYLLKSVLLLKRFNFIIFFFPLLHLFL